MAEKTDTKTKDADILATAKERFERAQAHESEDREKRRQDVRFAASSPDDPWQWEDRVYRERTTALRPTLTVNKMPQHVRQVTNDIRQNRPAIRYRPADDQADVQVADILMGIVRHIEANSDADMAYDASADWQVMSGLGYIGVRADYVSEMSFDQDIFIRRIPNPFKCWDDPDITCPVGSDRKFFFIEERLSEEEFKAQFPDAEPIDWNFVQTSDGWFSGDKHVRLCEYYSVEETTATLQLWANGETSIKGDPLPPGVYAGEKPIKTRPTKRCKVIWRKLNGQEILETREFPSKYIPFARVEGNRYEVDGKVILSGIIRNAKDSQRIYNVAQSAIVERVMQAPKAPYVASARAIEGYETEWQTANTANHSFLPYNDLDEQGQPIPRPERVQAATVESGLSQVAMGAADDIKSETGQYDASLGQRSNETSGRAILARQREGDTATYHYVDNLGHAVRHIGRIILDMIPRIYDTRRVMRIIGEDDSSTSAVLDPELDQPTVEQEDEFGKVQRIFNPTVGQYDVYTSTGPSYTTRRIEAVEAMTSMTQANPQLWQVIGDQLVKSMDWPGAEDMAKRLKAMLLPQVQQAIDEDDKPEELPPQVKQAMEQMAQQIEQMGQALQAAQAELADKSADRDAKLAEAQIKAQSEVVKAQAEVETARIEAEAAMAGSQMDPQLARVLAERFNAIEQAIRMIAEQQQMQAQALTEIVQMEATEPEHAEQFAEVLADEVEPEMMAEADEQQMLFDAPPVVISPEDAALMDEQVNRPFNP